MSEPGPYYFRLNLYHRILHGMVITSFLGLALTGLPLKYSDTPWGRTLSHALGGPFTTGYLHRFFAIITFTYFALHLGYVARLIVLGRPGIYLEDLFVVPEMRGRGFGRALLSHLAKLAKDRKCGRLEWSVLDWNEPAIEFYKSLGARPMDEWHVFRLTGEALEKLARTEAD